MSPSRSVAQQPPKSELVQIHGEAEFIHSRRRLNLGTPLVDPFQPMNQKPVWSIGSMRPGSDSGAPKDSIEKIRRRGDVEKVTGDFGPEVAAAQTDDSLSMNRDNKAPLFLPLGPLQLLLLEAPEPNDSDPPTEGLGYGPGYEAEKRGDGTVEEVAGDFGPETEEEVAAVGFRRGGHGLEIGPGGLLHEVVADGDLAADGRGGGRGVDCGGGGEEVLERGVGLGLDGELEIYGCCGSVREGCGAVGICGDSEIFRYDNPRRD
ncbi:hypothetical protein Acr_12g0004840 [Actinidia rufa]|uniref:Uncharacterized protein n=1 Tax=Actinidia rufa TaxID=165716 RepID=A0A7J0FH76_9ERIC|nr:hypothetical protein Acr_12g0004840 [Actinidia rufa]